MLSDYLSGRLSVLSDYLKRAQLQCFFDDLVIPCFEHGAGKFCIDIGKLMLMLSILMLCQFYMTSILWHLQRRIIACIVQPRSELHYLCVM